jgi:23S rRNA (uracil1939-C5)-methyltransferase
MNNHSTPRCPHFDLCSGCTLQLGETPPVWRSVLSFFKIFSVSPSLCQAYLTQWRLKAKLAVRGSSEKPLIGLFKKGSHEVVSIPHCLVHHPSINQAAKIIAQTIQKTKFPIYDEVQQRGLLRYLQLFVHRTSGAVQLSLVLNAPSSSSLIEFFCRQLEHDLWHSIWINFHPAANNRVLGDVWQKISGHDWLFQPFLKEEIPFHPGAFAQAHLELFEQLALTIRSWVQPGSRVAELFAGVGLIGASLFPHLSRLLLVENNPFAELSFRARYQGKSHPEYLLEDASQFTDFSSFDTLIVDPPRKGLGSTLLKNLCCAANLRLIYVSCGWQSFQSDCQALIAAGWSLKQAEGFLLFPGTDHIETVALFEK